MPGGDFRIEKRMSGRLVDNTLCVVAALGVGFLAGCPRHDRVSPATMNDAWEARAGVEAAGSRIEAAHEGAPPAEEVHDPSRVAGDQPSDAGTDRH